jgi:predicted ATPase/class 3 adenylate cyclase
VTIVATLDEAVTTFLFTDIEGSTRLWEVEPERMRPALERHDTIARGAVKHHGGEVVKMTGDGIHAAFSDPLDALGASLELQQALADAQATEGLALKVRCGMHAGPHQRRDDDFFGAAVNRAARIMAAAHGGQTLLSATVAQMLSGRLPEHVGLRDLGSVRLRDLGSPERIFQLVHPELRSEFPALRSLEETPNNLPHEVTSFIGRDAELARAGELLARNRLLTIFGMGGLGKTRLSLHVAAEAMDDYPDGVWFVELAPLRDPRGVAQAVATVLGVKEEAGRPVTEALARHVAKREILIVLDNCEHLVQACADFARQMLESGARLKVLATSREPLHVAGEVTFPLTALSVPDLRAPFEPAVLAQNEAAQLFIERAVAARPDFEVTTLNSSAIAAICHRLDGIPLALELAAARVRSLPVEQLAARLKDRFKLLKGGDLTQLPRQQTLRALIDWSHDLLSEAERVVLRQLAVFSGGWTLEAAEAVCIYPEEDVVDLLGRLVDKSLAALSSAAGRYSQLETVRQYSQERLEASDDSAHARSRHLAFYASMAEEAKTGMMGAGQSSWLEKIDEERENIIAAHAYADATPNGAQDGLRLISALKLYWINRGLLELGHTLTTEALERPLAAQRNFARCKALFDLGQIRYCMGRYDEARICLEEGLCIARELDDERAAGKILQHLGMAAFGDGDVDKARGYLEEAFALASGGADQRSVAAAASQLGQLNRVQGRNSEAHLLFERAIEIARSQGDVESGAIGQVNQSMLAILESDTARATGLLEQAVAVAMGLNAKRLGQAVIEVCAALEASSGRWTNAAILYGAAEAHASATGIHRDPADEQFLAPLIAAARTAGDASFDSAQAEGRALAYDEAIGFARRLLLTSRR